MSRAGTTIDARTEPRSRARKRPPVLALVVAWCAREPGRVGEVALFPEQSPPMVLGRGEAAGAEARVRFFRIRGSAIEPTSPLASTSLSRRQLQLVTGNGFIAVKQVGRGTMRVNGEPTPAGKVGPGDVLSLRRDLVLFCTRVDPGPRRLRFPARGAYGRPDASGILGESSAIIELREQVGFAAASGAHVLVTGESGTGKELVARAIHGASGRGGAFVARNAAALPPGLIDAELFGNIRNYPHAGMPDRPGLIGEASGGTLFLDEIGELPSELQAHLLRVLDGGGEFHRLGEATARRSEFRLVAATNRERAALKHDLAARLTVEVEVPPLAARREDIPLLARHLVERLAEQSPAVAGRFVDHDAGGAGASLSAALVEHLLRRDYPGNVRDLEAVLLRAMAASEGDVIDLPVEKPPPAATRALHSAAERAAEPSADALKRAVASAGGNHAGAARALGLSRHALYRLLRKHGLERRREAQ